MEEEFRTVAQFADAASAEITAGMLRANGIPAEVFGQTSSYPSINANIDSIKVKVNASDYDAAKALIGENQPGMV